MNVQNNLNFNRIADAIDFIKNNIDDQPSLDFIAAQVNMSPSHFQKMFTEWAGVSPKKFIQFITITHAKKMLVSSIENKQPSLFNTALEAGLSGTARLHDLFINIEGMTPGDFKNGAENLTIKYNFSPSIFGDVLIASTPIGVCYVAFVDEVENATKNLFSCFPKATFIQAADAFHYPIIQMFAATTNGLPMIKLHLKGTPFQLKVWEALLKIPMGKLATYGYIADKINHPKAARAVGSAIAANPIAFLIPCHRVIQATGLFGQYMWGAKRKTAMIGWEAVSREQ